MIHTIVTCDKCNPQDQRKGITRLPAPNEGRGIFEGPIDAARDAGWTINEIVYLDICPDCLGEMEVQEN